MQLQTQNNELMPALTQAFEETISYWLAELNNYTFEELTRKPAPDKWSVGQVYVHVIEATEFFLSQVRICMASNEHVAEEALLAAKRMFAANSFPDAILEGPPTNAITPQPASLQALTSALSALLNEVHNVGLLLGQPGGSGKTKHPGLHYFNAAEWYQFADMHWRHHLRQKARLDLWLQNTEAV